MTKSAVPVLHRFLRLVRSNQKYILFSLLKYVEYAITASLFFLLARMVSPAEYGRAVPAFLAISYSAFAALGANLVMIKWHAMRDDPEFRTFLLQYAFVAALLAGTGVLLLFNCLLQSDVRFWAGLIAALKLVQESLVNALRARQVIWKINAIYLTFSLCFAVTFGLAVSDVATFFHYWMVSLCLSVVLGFALVLQERCRWLKPQRLLDLYFANWRPMLLDGLKLAALSAVLPLFLTIDRVVLMRTGVSSEAVIANLQLADNLALVISFGVAPVLYAVTPLLLENLKSGKLSVARFYSQSYQLVGGFLLLALLFVFPFLAITQMVFPKYIYLQAPLPLYLVCRLLHLGLFSSNLLCIAQNREGLYIKLTYGWFLVLLLGLLGMTRWVPSASLYWAMPLCVVCSLLCVHLSFFLVIRKGSFTTITGPAPQVDPTGSEAAASATDPEDPSRWETGD